MPIVHCKLVCAGLQAIGQSVVQESPEEKLHDSRHIWVHALCVNVITRKFRTQGIQLEHGRGK